MPHRVQYTKSITTVGRHVWSSYSQGRTVIWSWARPVSNS